MEKVNKILEDITETELRIEQLRVAYRESTDTEERVRIHAQALELIQQIVDFKRDLNLYHRIERMKQIAKEVGAKRKAVK